MKNKVLTIIVPSYNMEAFLPKCLGSLIVAPELMACLEVLVVNDGSKDRTSEIARDFAAKWPGTFKVIDKVNGHYGSCINVGIAESSGEYIKILDADDYFSVDAFRIYLGFLLDLCDHPKDDFKQPDMVWNDFAFVDEKLRFNRVCRRCPKGFDVVDIEDARVRLDGLYMHQVAYRSSLLKSMKYRQIEGICYTDNQWCQEPVAFAGTVAYCPVVLYNYLVGRSGQSVSVEVWRKNLWMLGKVAQHMTRFACDADIKSDKVRLYADNCVMTILSKFYDIALMVIHSKDSDKMLSDFDDELRRLSPHFHQRLEDSMVSKRIGFRYLSVWRKTRNSSSLKFAAFRAYRRLAGMCCGNMRRTDWL